MGCSNWPIMLASVRKSFLALSEDPGLRVFMATHISSRPGYLSLPLQTSPNSPVDYKFLYSISGCDSFDCMRENTSANDGLNGDARSVDFSGKLLDCLVRILVSVGVDVGAGGPNLGKQWRGH